jgi:hypothetical protein
MCKQLTTVLLCTVATACALYSTPAPLIRSALLRAFSTIETRTPQSLQCVRYDDYNKWDAIGDREQPWTSNGTIGDRYQWKIVRATATISVEL